jgi:hypothetical protein
MFLSPCDCTNIFLWAIGLSEYADVVTTIQPTIDDYCHLDNDGLLPEHLHLYKNAIMIHSNAFPTFTGFLARTLLGIPLTPMSLLTATFKATAIGFSVPN